MSSTIGLRKPEAKAYDYVVREIGVSAARIVFFDDLLENIEGARAQGFVHVKSGADVANVLTILISQPLREYRTRLFGCCCCPSLDHS